MMSRPGYTNVPPSKARDALLATICTHLALDPEQHSARLRAIDFALRITVQQVERTNEMSSNWITSNYPKGARITTPSRNDPTATVGATVENHYTGLSKHIEGIVVRDDDGNVYNIEAGFLNEEGGGFVS